ncbi:hypothetical protein RNZ50_00365 [Paracoccaceae bacterium Fryx2]|nr:hypothetical protein [Paracoccaceae bacterium Fryx2]
MTGPVPDYARGIAAARAAIAAEDRAGAARLLAGLQRDLAAAGDGALRLEFLSRFAAAHGLRLEAPPPAPPLPAPAPLPAPMLSHPRPRLYVDAQHGLGNRLRAIASAAVIAGQTGRELVIVWQPDVHCECRWPDLFAHGAALIEASFAQQAAQAGCHLFNYMEVEPGACKDAPIPGETPAAGDIYVRSAYPLVSPQTSWKLERQFLHALVPVPEVTDLMRAVRHPNQVAAHVRMASGPAFEHLPYEAPENWTPEAHAALAEWRGRSHARHFIARIDALIAEGQADSLFLAADLPETYALFAERYGARLAVLPRSLFDRSARQAQYALADTLLLGRAGRFLGSTWSSMTDLCCATTILAGADNHLGRWG